jgi:hypothetical protein
MILKRLFFVFNVIAVMSLLMQGGYSQNGQAASPVSLEGTFIILWGDGNLGSGDTRTSYFLSTDQNNTIQLIVNEKLLSTMGGSTGLNKKAIMVQGMWQITGQSMLVQTITLASGEQAGTEGIYGPQPWVSILCKFSDYAIEPKNRQYFQEMYSSNYPGLDHFWQQNSYDLANLDGSDAFGWYTLPHDRAYYLPGGNLDWWRIASDCTGAADPYVDFTPYVGINLMFNANLDCCAWGGWMNLCLDGVCSWRMTREPPWGYQNISVIAHETGHGFGLPHSSGNYGQTYDNQWDLMSDSWAPCSRGNSDPIYGCIGQHTISYHKNMLGWFTPSQLYTANPGTLRTITLERIALPNSENYLGAFVPIYDSPDLFYTVESRQLIGYDAHNPGMAVIIHDVDPGS